MQAAARLTRRHFLGGIGGIGAVAATGAGAGVAAEADANAGVRGLGPQREVATARRLGPLLDLHLAATSFMPLSSVAYEYISPGGVRVGSGPGTWFDADLRLPVGSRLTSVTIFLNPNGVSRSVQIVRYRAGANPPTHQNLIDRLSSAISAVQGVLMPLTHDIQAGWDYRIGQVRLDAGGAILYGAKVRYRPPA